MIKLKNKDKTLQLRRTLFWDVNTESLDGTPSARLIAERVLTRGNLSEFKQLIGFYDWTTLRQLVVSLGNMDDRTLNFVSVYFNIPITEFTCYKKQQLSLLH